MSVELLCTENVFKLTKFSVRVEFKYLMSLTKIRPIITECVYCLSVVKF